MKLRIRKCDACYVTIDGVKSSDTVESLKLKIQEKVTDVLPNGQKLYHAGQLLNDGRKVACYNIQDDDIIHLWGWLRHTELIKVPPRKTVTVSKEGVSYTLQRFIYSEEQRTRKKQMQVFVRSFDGVVFNTQCREEQHH
ncbi:hypothetical protein Drorol1_Dr00015400 [Drosera rotundifolia]